MHTDWSKNRKRFNIQLRVWHKNTRY